MTGPLIPNDLPRLPPRAAESHKGSFGRVLIVGGARGMAGAPALAGMAALRSGAGLVQVAVPRGCLDVVAGFEPSYLTCPLAEDEAGQIAAAAQAELERPLATATALGCGPGLGRSPDLDRLVAWLYASYTGPAVFDADALNALATQPDVLARPGGPRVLTPHPGEFARLTGAPTPREAEGRARAAREWSARWGVVVVLKGHGSVITDGATDYRNPTGNPGLATGGTGDVLTGSLAALLAQGLAPLAAARLAAFVHGLAGDLAAAELGQVSLVASDLVSWLPRAWRHLAADR